jgi:16S rRNA processing protein RimM
LRSSSRDLEEGASGISDEFITLARILKTQGRRGEVAAEVHSSVPDRFFQGMRLFACGTNNDRRELRVEGFWPHKGGLVLKFSGVDSISEAETLIGSELQVPQAERARLEPGWTYVSDLVGCLVFDGNREIGKIKEVQFVAGEAPLLVVDGEKVYEIPFAESYLRAADLEHGKLRMQLPEGLLEVNAPLTEEEKRRNR